MNRKLIESLWSILADAFLFIYSFILGICEERLKGDEEGSQTDNWRNSTPGKKKKNSQCKETISQDLLCLKNSKEASDPKQCG